MKKQLIVILLLLLIGCLYLIIGKEESKKEAKKWPAENIRGKVANIEPEEVKEIIFDGLIRTRNLTKTSEIAPVLLGLKEAILSGDPKKGLPTDNNMTVELILKDGRTVGPFGFSTEKASHAFGKKFAQAWNEIFDQKIPID